MRIKKHFLGTNEAKVLIDKGLILTTYKLMTIKSHPNGIDTGNPYMREIPVEADVITQSIADLLIRLPVLIDEEYGFNIMSDSSVRYIRADGAELYVYNRSKELIDNLYDCLLDMLEKNLATTMEEQGL